MAKRIAKPKVQKEAKSKKPVAPYKQPFEFEVIDNFWNSTKFNKYSNYERGKAFYILNRRMAINFPREAAMVSKIGINTGQVVHWWKLFMSKVYSGKPGWLWEKAGKTVSTKKEYKPSDETVLTYCKWHDCTRKDVEEALKFFPKEMKEELEEIENIYKDK